MHDAWILNKLLMFVLGFSTVLKLVSRALIVNVSVEFYDRSDERLKGLFGLALVGFLLRLNMLEIIGEGHGKD
jgi:hypothetical protein